MSSSTEGTPNNIVAEEGVHLIFDEGVDAKQSTVIADVVTGREVIPGVSTTNAILAALDAGADVNTAGEDQQTALHYAASRGLNRIVDTLMEKGAALEQENEHGSTALHRAARQGRTQAVVSLLDAGADINAQTDYGKTPLHYASNQGHADVVRSLIGRGADVTLTDDKGQTALEGCMYRTTTQAFKDALSDRKATERLEYLEGLVSDVKKKFFRGEPIRSDVLEAVCKHEREQAEEDMKELKSSPSHAEAPSVQTQSTNEEQDVQLVRLRRKM